MNAAGISEKDLSHAQQELGWIHLFFQCVLGNSAWWWSYSYGIPCIDHGGPFHLAQLRLWNWRLRKWTLLRSQCSEPPRITPLGCTNASHPALTPEGMSSLCCPYVFHKSLAKVKLQLRNSSNSASVSDSVDETAGQSFRDFVWELETGTRGTLLKC